MAHAKSTPDTETEPSAAPVPAAAEKAKKSGRLAWLRSRRTLWIAGGSVALIAVLLAVPMTRYGILGLVVKRTATITVVDAQTGKPVAKALVSSGGHQVMTSNDGHATLTKLPVGYHAVLITKPYYGTFSQTVTLPLFGNKTSYSLAIKATGRTVKVDVTNKITGKALANVTLAAGDATAASDSDGHATLVLPPTPDGQTVTAKLDGYNQADLKISLSAGTASKLALVPTGKLYYLDKRTGRINVMKSNLDGSNPQVVLAGTGKEDDSGTVMLASRDWKYLALLSRRDSAQAKLYLIKTASDAVSVMDQGDITFNLSGWLDDNFVYTVDRPKALLGAYSQAALKSYNAPAGRITVIDQTEAEIPAPGVAFVTGINNIYLAKDGIVYAKFWNRWGYYLPASAFGDKTQLIAKTAPDGTNKKPLKTFAANEYQWANSKVYKPNEVYYQIGGSNNDSNGTSHYTYLEYEDGKIAAADKAGEDQFNSNESYPTYLASPSGKQTAWYDTRDGKNTLFKGDDEGGNGKELASLTKFVPYGWYSDDYLLLSQDQSELYIVPSDYSAAPLKLTEYHKPRFLINGYGGGYGAN